MAKLRGRIQSVSRACTLLETLQEHGPSRITDISKRTKLDIATCHHLLKTLVVFDFVKRQEGSKLYAVGNRISFRRRSKS